MNRRSYRYVVGFLTISTSLLVYYHVTITWCCNFRINKNNCIDCRIATISTKYRPTLLILLNKINFTLHEKCWEKLLRIKENGLICTQSGILFNFRRYARNYCIRERVSVCVRSFSPHFSDMWHYYVTKYINFQNRHALYIVAILHFLQLVVRIM